MGKLDSLQFTRVAENLSPSMDPTKRRRKKFAQLYQDQLRLVDALEQGREGINNQRGRSVRPLFFKDGDTYNIKLKYGNSNLTVADNNAVKAKGDYDSLRKTINTLIEAANDGELDKELAKAADRPMPAGAQRGRRKKAS